MTIVSPDVRAAEVTQAAIGRPEASKTSKRVAEVRKAMATDTSPASPLEKMRSAISGVAENVAGPKSENQTESFLTENFGAERNPSAGDLTPSPESEARRDSAERSIKIAESALDYKKLPKEQQRIILECAEEVLSLDPTIEATLPPKGSAARKAWIEKRFLGDPRVVAKIQEKLDSLQAERLPDNISARSADEARKKAEVTRRKAEVDRLNHELTRVTTRLGDFEPGQSADKELTRLTAERPNLDLQLARAQSSLDRIDRRIDMLTTRLQRASANEAIAINQEISALENSSKTLMEEVVTHSSSIKKHDSLLTEKQNLPGQRDRLQSELSAAQSEHSAAGREHGIANATLEQAQKEREIAEQKLTTRAGNIIQSSIAEVILEDIDAAEIIYQEKLDEFIAQSKDTADKAIGKQLKGRYVRERKPTLRDRRTTEANNIQIDSDISILASNMENGPRQLLEIALRQGLTEEVNSGKIQASEVEDIIAARMGDPEWVDRMSVVVGENALRERCKTKPLSEAEATQIAKTKLGERILTQAMSTPASENPPEVNAVVEELKKNGMVTPDKMDDKSKNWLLATLLILGASLRSMAVVVEPVNFNNDGTNP